MSDDVPKEEASLLNGGEEGEAEEVEELNDAHGERAEF